MNLRRLELTNGTAYQVGQPWPEQTDQPDRKVGPIFFRPETSDPVALGDEGDDANGVEGIPAHYEIWCVADEYFKPFLAFLFGQDADQNKALMAQAISKEANVVTTVVKVPHTAVLREFEDLHTMRALDQIAQRYKEIRDLEAAEEAAASEDQASPDNGQPQQTQPTG